MGTAMRYSINMETRITGVEKMKKANTPVYNEQGDYLGNVTKIGSEFVTVEKQLGSQGMSYDVKKERVVFDNNKAVVLDRE